MIIRRRTLLTATAAAALAPRAFAQASYEDIVKTVGGRNGQVIRVTTLKPEGPGSVTEAIKTKGPRIIVFEVGGVIDLAMKSLRIDEPYATIAGQTAPAPGITFIRGGVTIRANQTVIEHICVRPGEAGQPKKSGWECDGISSYGAANVRVQNCSITWATDEGLSASGPRFNGATLADWRNGTSHRVSFSYNIVAEGLSNSTHSKGEHSKGTLIHDNVSNAGVTDSLYAHNMERSILFKGGVMGGTMGGCIVYNPGKRFSHYNLHTTEWEGHPFETGEVRIWNNYFLAGPSTDPKAAAFMLGGEGDLRLDMANNLALDVRGAPLAQLGRFGSQKAKLIGAPAPPTRTSLSQENFPYRGFDDILANCGARPWDRDPIDARIVADVRNRTGRIIDSEQEVGGYPVRPETRAPFVEADWDMEWVRRR